MKNIIDENIFQDLDNWAQTLGITGEEALSLVVNEFYDTFTKEPRLEKFFVGIDEKKLRNHQLLFLTQLFSGKLAGGFTEKHIYASHKSLILNKGLNQYHFNFLQTHLLASLRKYNVPEDITGRVLSLLLPFRELFKKVTSRYSTAKEEQLFFAIDFDNDGRIESSVLLKLLEDEGLRKEDIRLTEVYRKLERYKDKSINFHEFSDIISSASLLINRAITGEFAIPDFKQFCEEMDAIYDEVIQNESGTNADYIPPLAKADPDKFGIVITTIDGQIYSKGDVDMDFSIQSMCKPFNYCFAVEELGEEEVHQHVGNEPSGRAFNNQELMERYLSNSIQKKAEKTQIPYNPMINAGAIMTSALIKSASSFETRFSHIRNEWSKLIGKPNGKDSWPRFNKDMAEQENLTGYNNIAMGYLLMASGKLPKSQIEITEPKQSNPENYNFFLEPSVTEALKLYFAVCSMELSAEEFSMAAATLSNGGVCPSTLERVLDPATVRQCLSITQTCGMYDGSGDFFYTIGLPAKSGVSGGLMLFVPKLMGMCIFSPRLDAQGNSVRGKETAKKIVQKYKIHLYDDIMSSPNRIDPRVSFSAWVASKNSEALWAASNGDLNTLKKLKENEYDLESGQYDLRTPMHLAAAEGNIEIVKFLLDSGVKQKPDRWGGYPISDAILNENHEIEKLFSAPDSESVHYINEKYKRKVEKASDYGNQLEIIEMLWAAKENDIIGVQRLVAKGIPVDVKDSDNRTPLHLASAEGHLDLVKYFVSHGHPIFVRDRWGAAPIDNATREERSDVIKFLSEF